MMILSYVRFASNSLIQILDSFLLLTGVDVVVNKILEEPRLTGELNRCILKNAYEICGILLSLILLIEKLSYRYGLIFTILHLLEDCDSIIMILCLCSKDTRIIHILLINSILRHLFLILCILHHIQIGDIQMAHEHFISRCKIALVVQINTILHQLLRTIILEHLVSNSLTRLGVNHLTTLLVERRRHSNLIGLDPVVITLNHSFAHLLIILGIAELSLNHCILILLVTNESGYIPSVGQILSLFVFKSSLNVFTCTCEVRRFSVACLVLCRINGFLLCIAASACKHEGHHDS